MHKIILVVALFAFLALPSTYAAPNTQFGNKKPGFIHHIVNFVNNLAANVNGTNATNGTTHPAPAGAAIPITRVSPPALAPSPKNTAKTSPKVSAPIPTNAIVVRPNENPALAVQRMSNSVLAINLMATIAPPAVRPCFIRPAFCPATSDACASSRCARMYANGVRIGSRFYRKVKCRLNYCRETCGKAEWFADGRRLIGCSDSISTVDEPVWSVQRVYPSSYRLDSRVLPSERVASTTPRYQRNMNGLVKRAIPTGDEIADAFNKVPALVQDLTDKVAEHADKTKTQIQSLGDKIKDTFNNLNPNTPKLAEDAIKASNMKNLTDFVDQQLADATKGMKQNSEVQEHDHETMHMEATKETSAANRFLASKFVFSFVLISMAFRLL